MTLSSEIAALTGNEGETTLRAIDARVLTLLCPSATIGHYTADDDGYVVFYARDIGIPDKSDCPNFTTSLDATLAEIRRRGWEVSLDDIGGIATCLICCPKDEKQLTQSVRAHPQGRGPIPSTFESDDNLALAALEALVRAVEGQG